MLSATDLAGGAASQGRGNGSRAEQASPNAADSAPGSSTTGGLAGVSAQDSAAGSAAGGVQGGEGARPEVLDPADMWRLGMAPPAGGGSAAGTSAGQSDGWSEGEDAGAGDEAEPQPGGDAAETVPGVRPAGGYTAQHRREQLADEDSPRIASEQGACPTAAPEAWRARHGCVILCDHARVCPEPDVLQPEEVREAGLRKHNHQGVRNDRARWLILSERRRQMDIVNDEDRNETHIS